MSKSRIRQHVNPLSRRFQQPLEIPDWNLVYRQCDRPIHLDIGCARGSFLLEIAQLQPNINFLGIEIRQSLVISANRKRDDLELSNLHYLFGNMNASASILLASLPKGSLSTISIQFPDPWFKKKHHKRRVVQPELVSVLVDYLVAGGKIFLQSDIEEVAIEMRKYFSKNPTLIQQHEVAWLENNPFPIATEREMYVLTQNLPIYRALFQKSLKL